MKETYFVIRNSDGDTTVREVSKETLLADIESGEYGENGRDILTSIPKNPDTNYWGEFNVLIIKGHIVVPKAETVITKYSIE